MGAGLGLEQADQAAPDGAADQAEDDDQQQVQAQWQVPGEAHVGGQD